MSSPNVWGSLREGECGHLSLVMLFVGVGLNSLGDPDINCSYWYVRLCWAMLVCVCGGGGERRLVLGVGEWARLEVGVGLNSRGGDAQSILPHAGNLDVSFASINLVRGMQGVTKRTMAVWHLLYHVDTVILRLRLQQYLRGGNWGVFLDVNLPGL